MGQIGTLAGTPSKSGAALQDLPFAGAIEPREPFGHEGQARRVNCVQPGPTASLLLDEARVLQNAQVARGCGPFVRKTTGDLARGGASTEVYSHENLTACRVRKSGHHGIERR